VAGVISFPQVAPAALLIPFTILGTTETRVIPLTLPANSAWLGQEIIVRAFGLGTSAGAAAGSIARVRMGPVTLTGTVLASIGGTSAAGTNVPFCFEFHFNVVALGVAGKIVAGGTYRAQSPAGILSTISDVAVPINPITVNTTVDNIIELTYNPGSSGTNAKFTLAEVR